MCAVVRSIGVEVIEKRDEQHNKKNHAKVVFVNEFMVSCISTESR